MRIKMGAQCCGLCPYELQILQCKDDIKAAASLNNNKKSLGIYKPIFRLMMIKS